MRDEYINTYVTDTLVGPNIAYVLNDDEMFYDIGFRVAENQINIGVLPCYKLRHNGKLKFVFLTEKYVMLKDMLYTLNENDLLVVLHRLYKAIKAIEESGFLNLACVDSRLERIWIDRLNLEVKLTYLPLNIQVNNSQKEAFEYRICQNLKNELLVFEQKYSENILSVIKNQNFRLTDLYEQWDEQPNLYISQEKDGAEVEQSVSVKNRINNPILVALNGEFRIPITKNEFIVGKSQERADGVIQGNSAISRTHCKFICQTDKWYVEDMGSANGTYVNNRRIRQGEIVEINIGSSIRLADMYMEIKGV